MKGKMLDTYEHWEKSGHLDEKLKAIKEMVAKRATHRQVAEYLGISEKSIIKLRKAHPLLNDAFNYGNEELKKNLEDAIYRRAMGFEYEETQTIIEETKTGTKKRITKFKKQALPDITAIKYLLITKFGIDYNDGKELNKGVHQDAVGPPTAAGSWGWRTFTVAQYEELMARRIENGEEEWVNEHSDETNNRTKGIWKQPTK